jgi:hypothetical protein
MRALLPGFSGLVVAVGLVLGVPTAHAAPARDASRHKHKKVKRAVEVAPPEAADADAGARAPSTPPATREPRADRAPLERANRHVRAAAPPDAKPVAFETAAAGSDGIELEDHHRAVAPHDAKQVAFETVAAGSDGIELEDKDASKPAARLVKLEPTPARRRWQLEIGPYLWASSVNANVSLGGPVSTGTEIGFIPLARHARYGAELLAELRYGRFAISGDLMYGSAVVTGSTNVASVMVTLNGNASSLLVDSAVGYQVIGDEDAVFSLEARGGVRYQRTAVDGAVSAVGVTVQVANAVDDGGDMTAGTRAVLRPARWLSLSGMFDIGVVGVSDSTWSASADANLRVSSHVLISAGWRTLSLERSRVSLTLQGPRAAVQLVF